MLNAIFLPFAIFWGLSLSPLSLLSTLLGTPIVFAIIIVTLFSYILAALGCSLYYPGLLLNKLAHIWQNLITYKINTPLLVAPNISTYFLIFSSISFFIFYYKNKQKNLFCSLISILYILLLFLISHALNRPNKYLFIKNVTIYNDKKTVLVINKIPRNYTYWHFRVLLAELRKKYGRNSTDTLIINKLDKTTTSWLKEVVPEKFTSNIIILNSKSNSELVNLAQNNDCQIQFL